MAGRCAAAREGKLFRPPIHGFRKHPVSRGVHLVVPEQAEVVRDLFAMVASGSSARYIAEAMSVRTPSPAWCRLAARGGAPDPSPPWTSAEVRAIVRQPLYRGLVVYFVVARLRKVQDRDASFPVEDHIFVEAPAYRIICEDLAARAKAALGRQVAPSFFGKPDLDSSRP